MLNAGCTVAYFHELLQSLGGIQASFTYINTQDIILDEDESLPSELARNEYSKKGEKSEPSQKVKHRGGGGPQCFIGVVEISPPSWWPDYEKYSKSSASKWGIKHPMNSKAAAKNLMIQALLATYPKCMPFVGIKALIKLFEGPAYYCPEASSSSSMTTDNNTNVQTDSSSSLLRTDFRGVYLHMRSLNVICDGAKLASSVVKHHVYVSLDAIHLASVLKFIIMRFKGKAASSDATNAKSLLWTLLIKVWSASEWAKDDSDLLKTEENNDDVKANNNENPFYRNSILRTLDQADSNVKSRACEERASFVLGSASVIDLQKKRKLDGGGSSTAAPNIISSKAMTGCVDVPLWRSELTIRIPTILRHLLLTRECSNHVTFDYNILSSNVRIAPGWNDEEVSIVPQPSVRICMRMIPEFCPLVASDKEWKQRCIGIQPHKIIDPNSGGGRGQGDYNSRSQGDYDPSHDPIPGYNQHRGCVEVSVKTLFPSQSKSEASNITHEVILGIFMTLLFSNESYKNILYRGIPPPPSTHRHVLSKITSVQDEMRFRRTVGTKLMSKQEIPTEESSAPSSAHFPSTAMMSDSTTSQGRDNFSHNIPKSAAARMNSKVFDEPEDLLEEITMARAYRSKALLHKICGSSAPGRVNYIVNGPVTIFKGWGECCWPFSRRLSSTKSEQCPQFRCHRGLQSEKEAVWLTNVLNGIRNVLLNDCLYSDCQIELFAPRSLFTPPTNPESNPEEGAAAWLMCQLHFMAICKIRIDECIKILSDVSTNSKLFFYVLRSNKLRLYFFAVGTRWNRFYDLLDIQMSQMARHRLKSNDLGVVSQHKWVFMRLPALMEEDVVLMWTRIVQAFIVAKCPFLASHNQFDPIIERIRSYFCITAVPQSEQNIDRIFSSLYERACRLVKVSGNDVTAQWTRSPVEEVDAIGPIQACVRLVLGKLCSDVCWATLYLLNQEVNRHLGCAAIHEEGKPIRGTVNVIDHFYEPSPPSVAFYPSIFDEAEIKTEYVTGIVGSNQTPFNSAYIPLTSSPHSSPHINSAFNEWPLTVEKVKALGKTDMGQ